jgi:3-methyladenine DNA glycosylase AlkD
MKDKKHTYKDIENALQKLASKRRAAGSARFFKTGKGLYGEGDVFIGITVPQMRVVAKEFREISIREIGKLLKSKIHEHRYTALNILVLQYERGNEIQKKEIYDFYLSHTNSINNWDLVDTSAPYIVGNFLLREKDRKILYEFANSKKLFERRIAVVATYAFIKAGQYNDILKLTKILIHDREDLMHKACGWMLREVGKKDQATLVKFLEAQKDNLPRTALRYAIERFTKTERAHFMARGK